MADDIAPLSSTEQRIQTKTDKLAHEAKRVGLKVNVDKCKLLRINSRNNDVVEVNGQEIEDVDRFVYLGATVSKEGEGTQNIHNRVLDGDCVVASHVLTRATQAKEQGAMVASHQLRRRFVVFILLLTW